jgi:hypothetical protein
MKLLFKTPHLIEAQSLSDFLASQGIESFMMNENDAFYAQGSISEGMPELWVADDAFESAAATKRDWEQALG